MRTGDAYLPAICVPYTPERRAACPGAARTVRAYVCQRRTYRAPWSAKRRTCLPSASSAPSPKPNPKPNPKRRWLQPLLAEGKVEVQAAVAHVPPQLERMSSIRVALRVLLRRAAFAEAAELAPRVRVRVRRRGVGLGLGSEATELARHILTLTLTRGPRLRLSLSRT